VTGTLGPQQVSGHAMQLGVQSADHLTGTGEVSSIPIL
jgi:hypothetical protein